MRSPLWDSAFQQLFDGNIHIFIQLTEPEIFQFSVLSLELLLGTVIINHLGCKTEITRLLFPII
jgi:hypothetical protein